MVREVGLPASVESGDGRLQVVVDPKAAHRVVHGGVDAHRRLVRVVGRDLLVHLEQVAILGADHRLAQLADLLHRGGGNALDVGFGAAIALNGTGVVEVHSLSGFVHPESSITALLGGPARHIARHQVAEGRVPALEVVIAPFLGDVRRTKGAIAEGLHIGLLLGHPDAAVVPEGLGHQRQLGLIVAADRNARRVDLRVGGVGHVGALLVGLPSGGNIRAHGIGAQEEHVAVSSATQDHRVGTVTLNLTGRQVAGDDAPGLAVDHDHIHELMAVVHGDLALGNLAAQGAVGTEQELLSCLALGVERPAHLDTAKRTVVQQATVLPGERDTLGDALVDDVGADLGEAVHVGLPAPVVAPLDRVVEQAVDRVPVVLVVLGRIDAALGSDRVGAARAVLEAERLDVVPHLGEGGRRGAAGQSGADDNHVNEALVGRVHQPDAVLVVRPLVRQVSLRNLGVERDTVLGHLRHLFFDSDRQAWVMYMNTMMAENSTGTTTLNALPSPPIRAV